MPWLGERNIFEKEEKAKLRSKALDVRELLSAQEPNCLPQASEKSSAHSRAKEKGYLPDAKDRHLLEAERCPKEKQSLQKVKAF